MTLLNGFKLCWILLGIAVLIPPDGLAMAIEPMLDGSPMSISEAEREDPQDKWRNLVMTGSSEDDSVVKVPLGKWPALIEALQDEAFVNRLTQERLYRLNNLRGNAEDRSRSGGEWPMGAVAMNRPWTWGPVAVKKDAVNVTPEGKMPIKYHGIKKNAQFRKQYMSPCHFKICNMGRKRNAD